MGHHTSSPKTKHYHILYINIFATKSSSNSHPFNQNRSPSPSLTCFHFGLSPTLLQISQKPSNQLLEHFLCLFGCSTVPNTQSWDYRKCCTKAIPTNKTTKLHLLVRENNWIYCIYSIYEVVRDMWCVQTISIWNLRHFFLILRHFLIHLTSLQFTFMTCISWHTKILSKLLSGFAHWLKICKRTNRWSMKCLFQGVQLSSLASSIWKSMLVASLYSLSFLFRCNILRVWRSSFLVLAHFIFSF